MLKYLIEAILTACGIIEQICPNQNRPKIKYYNQIGSQEKNTRAFKENMINKDHKSYVLVTRSHNFDPLHTN